ncbi:MAG: SDR family oxidoreductase [Phycisphaerae bacterium]|nr:SDR family oxidoreductase [Phycisphaerae bacterium]
MRPWMEDVTLRDKVVLITGASRGLGRDLVYQLASAGAAVAFCARRYQNLQPIEEELTGAGRAAMAVPCDVRAEADVIRMIHRVERRFGAIDGVINNATIYGPRVPIEEYPLDAWREVVETNLTGAFIVCREAIPAMTRRGDGSIINITHGIAATGRRDLGAFLASKCALEGFSLMLANELKAIGIRVNIVDPSPARTDARNATIRAGDPGMHLFNWLVADASKGVTGRRLRAADYRTASDGTFVVPS